jgi:hypothetical protein
MMPEQNSTHGGRGDIQQHGRSSAVTIRRGSGGATVEHPRPGNQQEELGCPLRWVAEAAAVRLDQKERRGR